MRDRWGRWFRAGLGILAITVTLEGCEKSSTRPEPTHTVSGTVQEPGGGTVEAAQVILESDGPLSDGLSLYTETDSDSAGRFNFGALKSGAYIVGARHAGLAVGIRFSVPSGSLTLTLQPAGRLVGTARYADRSRHDGIAVYPPLSIFGSFTDSTGAWETGGVPEGTWQVVAEVFASFDYRIDSATVVVRSGQTTTVPPLVVERAVSVQ